MSSANPHRETLRKAMQDNATERLAQLWTESQPMVASYILSLIPDFHRAEDVLQQVAVVLVRRFAEYDSARPFLPWALGIARNAAFESRRRSAVEQVPLMDEHLVESLQAVLEEEEEFLISIRKALQNCLRMQRKQTLDVLRMRYVHDLKPQDVAKQLGTSSGAVRVMLHRARESLRICIERSMGATG